MGYRRFEIINEENKNALEAMLKRKNISRGDLILILSTLKIREDILNKINK